MEKNPEDAQRASETFDSIAEHFDKTRNRPWKEVVEFIKNIDGRLLDIGCGNGRHILEGIKNGLKVVGIDASRELLKISKKKFGKEIKKDVDLIRSGVKDLPFKKNSFDNVIYIATIHHLKDGRVGSLKEAKRVLRPEGRILISSWARELDRWDLEKEESEVLVPWHREDGEIIDRFYHLYTLDQLEKDVVKSGLSVSRTFRSGGNNYIEANNTHN